MNFDAAPNLSPAQVLANTVMRLQFIEQLYKRQPEEVGPEFARLRTALQSSVRRTDSRSVP